MGDVAADAEPPSGAALAISLGRGEAAALQAVHDAYGPDLIGYAEFLLAGRPVESPAHRGGADGPTPHPADEAAEAVLDALLVATGAAGDLTDPDRMRAWLLALTRNECLRRRPGTGGSPTAEAAELGRRGLRRADVAALLGFAPAALPRRVPAVETVPAWLRAELLAAAGPEGAPRRGELTRRARPFDPDGFPVPLDRRRLSGKVLAWSAAAVVVIALGLLVTLPTWGNADVSAPGPALAAGRSDEFVPAAEEPSDSLPTLGDTPFGSLAGTAGTPVSPAPASTSASAPTPGTGASATDPAQPETAGRHSRSAGAVTLTWSPAPGLTCGGEWTAQLHATTGGVEVSEMVASSRGRTVQLHRDGDGWSGDLTGLPTDRTVSVAVTADGSVRAASARLTSGC